MRKARKLAPISPGEMLEEESLKPMAISKYRLAKEIGVPAQRIGEIVAGRRAITADTDLRLCRFFGLSDGWWLRGQVRYDMERARDTMAATLDKIRPWSESKSDLKVAKFRPSQIGLRGFDESQRQTRSAPIREGPGAHRLRRRRGRAAVGGIRARRCAARSGQNGRCRVHRKVVRCRVKEIPCSAAQTICSKRRPWARPETR
jgi:antitoxin HigA-1